MFFFYRTMWTKMYNKVCSIQCLETGCIQAIDKIINTCSHVPKRCHKNKLCYSTWTYELYVFITPSLPHLLSTHQHVLFSITLCHLCRHQFYFNWSFTFLILFCLYNFRNHKLTVCPWVMIFWKDWGRSAVFMTSSSRYNGYQPIFF